MKRDEQKSDVLGVWMGEEREEEEVSEYRERVCCVCEKAFRSGKALGGHMRSHVMKKRSEFDLVEKKKKKKMMKKMAECSCVICGKKFPSMKSLFGHMRCHPGRDWRGINPPPNLTSDGEKAVDLTESLRGWPVTAKRGGKGKATAEDDRLRDAVNFLMTLASAEGRESVDQLKVVKKKRRKKVKLCDLNLMENDKKICDSNKKQLDIVLHHHNTNLLDLDLNEVPPTDPQFVPVNYFTTCV